MNLVVRRSVVSGFLGCLCSFPGGHALLDAGVVDTEELVGPGGHVDVVGFPLSTLFVNELVNRLVLRRKLHIG